MRVLFLHPEDGAPAQSFPQKFDMVVDLARAPAATYARWSRQLGCEVKSIFDLADPVGDLAALAKILRNPQYQLLDEQGLDWWNLASYLATDALSESLLLHRLAKTIGEGAELVCTRPDRRVELLQRRLNASLFNLASDGHSTGHRIRHYRKVFSKLDQKQIAQVIADKWDPQHRIRRIFGRREDSQRVPVVLLPSAYINVSRTAVAYARLLPEQQFLLIYARSSGKLSDLPPNVRSAPLHPYYESGESRDLAGLLDRWKLLKQEMIATSEELNQAALLGGLDVIPDFIARGAGARDAWNQVFDAHNVVGCLSADDTNAYSRIPLVLAEGRGMPSVACHHGALDFRMAIKTRYGSAFLAKSEMERDYLENVCKVPDETIALGAPHTPHFEASAPSGRSWLAFFTEPYQADRWRMEEVYADLLPKLLDLSRSGGMRLVLKLHPFESVKEHRNLHARLLSPSQRGELDILDGQLAAKTWSKIKIALTVQSSVALECTQRGVPVFLCTWLRARYGGYAEQFARFGAGQIVEQSSDLAFIPGRLAGYKVSSPEKLGSAINPKDLQNLLVNRVTQIPEKARIL
ncbi:MAG TPA: hypothetical protein VH088_17090 [Terriglobales bacterium]|jgi:hypothetical protein|nr:hypothetical protein [Terriglobales bacterium]